MTPNQAYEILKNNSYKDITEKQNCLDIIKTNPVYACYYANEVIKGRWPEYEESIKKDPYYAYYAYFYANEVIKGRWTEGEESIKTSPKYAYLYARDVIKDRWIECEESIKTSPQHAYLYANEVIKGRWTEAEESIKNDPKWAYFYANEVIKDRWPEGEESIKKDPEYAYLYADEVIKGRWIEGEESIKNDPQYAYLYAHDVIEGRWIEFEESIKSSTALVKYCKSINQRIVEKEYLLKGKSKIDYYIYFNIQLEEEDLNKEIANCLIGKKSKYLEKVQKEKTLVIKYIKNLIDLGLISENDCIKNLINNQ